MNKKKVEKELEVKNLKGMTRKELSELKVKDLKDKVFTNIKKLKCDYTTYKEERTKYNMPVEEVYSKCGKSFKAGEEIYTAFEEGKLGSCIICGNCAKGE